MDIVYLLKDSDHNEELVFSMRSLKNIPHGKVFLVGGFPSEINPEKVYHIPTYQGPNKYENTTTALRAAASCEEVSDDFILMNDDFFIMSPIKNPVSELNLYRGYLMELIASYDRRPVYNIHYYNALCDVYSFLLQLGYDDPKCYELHIPMVMNKKKVLDMLTIRQASNSLPRLLFRTLYGNLFVSGSVCTKDVKLSAATPMLSENPYFLSTSDGYFAKIRLFIRSIFNEKSEYEL